MTAFLSVCLCTMVCVARARMDLSIDESKNLKVECEETQKDRVAIFRRSQDLLPVRVPVGPRQSRTESDLPFFQPVVGSVSAGEQLLFEYGPFSTSTQRSSSELTSANEAAAKVSVRSNSTAQERIKLPGCANGTLLLISAVGRSDAGIRTTAANLNHLRNRLKNCLDVFIMNYGGNATAAKLTADLLEPASSGCSRWTSMQGSMAAQVGDCHRNIEKLFNFPAMTKFAMIQAALTNFSEIEKYDWIWTLDEDIDVREIDITQFLLDAEETRGSIVEPSRSLRDGLSCAADKLSKEKCYFQATHSCSFRYVDFIEVQAPMFRPRTLWNILTACKGCIDRESTWGLDHVWCRMSARLQGQDAIKTCAILDQHTYVHLDFQTHQKYRDKHFDSINGRHFGQVGAKYPLDFVNEFSMICVSRGIEETQEKARKPKSGLVL